jgi:hypothetical protein
MWLLFFSSSVRRGFSLSEAVVDVDAGAEGKVVAINVEPEGTVCPSVPLLWPGLMVAVVAEFDRDKEPGDMKPGCAEGILVRFDRKHSVSSSVFFEFGRVGAGGVIGIEDGRRCTEQFSEKELLTVVQIC